MALESYVSAAEDVLIGGLNLSMPPGASYVVDRRSATLMPSSGVQFSPLSLRLIRFTLASATDWVVPESVRIGFTVQNLDGTNAIQPISVHAGSIFSRLRVLCGSTLVEDISAYSRLVNMLALLDSPGKQQMDAAEGFGCQAATEVNNRLVPETIAGGGSRRVTCGLLSGLLHQPKWLPLSMTGGITYELECGWAHGLVLAELHGRRHYNHSEPKLADDRCTAVLRRRAR